MTRTQSLPPAPPEETLAAGERRPGQGSGAKRFEPKRFLPKPPPMAKHPHRRSYPVIPN